MNANIYDTSKYRVNLPYPEVEVQCQNPYYASLLQDDYSGVVSELSAITQYSYHHFVLDNEYPEVADALICIAIVEMEHLGLLANAILKLGGNPIYMGSYSNNGQYWNGSYVSYSTIVQEALIDDIDAEVGAIQGYRNHIALINDTSIQNLLNRIILDEELHLKIFIELLHKYT